MKIKERYEWEANRNLLSKRGSVHSYYSKDTILQREVCLKMTLIQNELDLQNIAQEAKEAMLSFHPNLCSYYDVIIHDKINTDTKEDYNLILVSEYIDGGNIVEFCSLYKNEQILEKLLLHVLNGLSYLNEKGTNHPSLRPTNILVKKLFQNPTAKIADYISIPTAETQSIKQHSAEYISYLSPEMIASNGLLVNRVSADIWSFGVILFELLAEYNPFYKRNFTAEETINHVQNHSPDFSVLEDSSYQSIVKKCLAKDPDKRYQNIAELINDIKTKNTVLDSNAANATAATFSLSPEEPVTPTIEKTIETKEQKVETRIDLTLPLVQENEPIVRIKEEKKAKPFYKRMVKMFSQPADPSIADFYIEKEKDFSIGVYVVTIGIIFGLFLSVIMYSEYVERKQETEKRKIIVKRRNIYHTQVSEDNTNVAPSATETPNQTASKAITPIEILTFQTPQTTPLAVETPKPDVNINSNQFSALQNEQFKIGEMRTLNLSGRYPYPNVKLQYNADNIDVKEIGKQLYIIKPKGAAVLTVVNTDNGDILETKKINPAVTAESVTAYIGTDLRNSRASSLAVISRLGIKALSQNENYEITSFRLSTITNGEYVQSTSYGYLFSDKMKQLIKNAAVGQKITFDQIKARNESGQEISLKEVYVHISEN